MVVCTPPVRTNALSEIYLYHKYLPIYYWKLFSGFAPPNVIQLKICTAMTTTEEEI